MAPIFIERNSSSFLKASELYHFHPLPITSYACQWKAPRKRKESDARIADLKFEKHVYGRVRKHQLDPIDDFDPRPPQFRGKLHSRLPDIFEKVTGKGLGFPCFLTLPLRYGLVLLQLNQP